MYNKIKLKQITHLNLLKAFKQDVIKKRYKNWSELINYCKYSAVPVGRFLIDLHKEKQKAVTNTQIHYVCSSSNTKPYSRL